MTSAGLFAGLLPSIGTAAPACAPTLLPADEVALTGLINAERRAEGVPKVVTQPVMVAAGRRRSMAMARGGAFAHSSTIGWAAGAASAQNIARAMSVQEAFQAMLASPPHRQNMLSKSFRRTGVGAARDCSGQIFFTINLAGTPRQ